MSTVNWLMFPELEPNHNVCSFSDSEMSISDKSVLRDTRPIFSDEWSLEMNGRGHWIPFLLHLSRFFIYRAIGPGWH